MEDTSSEIVVGLDIGTTKIVVIVGRVVYSEYRCSGMVILVFVSGVIIDMLCKVIIGDG